MPADLDSTSGVVQCDVTLACEHTGWKRTFTLRVGNILRIGRSSANDVVLDFDGVSLYHAELFLRPLAGGHGLCVRDNSKNGTGVRPGGSPAWEPLRRGAFRALDHGWRLAVPLRGRRAEPEPRGTMTVQIGERVCAAEAAELDGEAWEPEAAAHAPDEFLPGDHEAAQPPAPAPPPPPDLDGGAFEEPPPPPVPAPQSQPTPAWPAQGPAGRAVEEHYLAREQWIGAAAQVRRGSPRAARWRR